MISMRQFFSSTMYNLLASLRGWIARYILVSAPTSIEYISIVPHFFRRTIEKLERRCYVWAITELEATSRASAERWRALQVKKLKKILIHAKRHVLYWQQCFAAHGFDPEKFKNAKEIEKIPIMTRGDLKRISLKNLIATNLPSRRSIESFTSGSTAEPLKIFQDIRMLFRRRLTAAYELNYARRCNSPALVISLSQIRHLKHLNGYHVLRGLDLENTEWRKSVFYPKVALLKPRTLITTPTYLKRLRAFCEGDHFFFSTIQNIRYYGEYLDTKEREELEKFFHCPIYGIYGSQECSLIAIQCKNYRYHLAPWMNYVEILDDNGNALPLGRRGKIVITSLENEYMPIIRYQIGDSGVLLSGTCDCGKTTPRIEVEGRIMGYIDFTDGSRFFISSILKYFSENFFESIRQFQLEQNSTKQVFIRFVPASGSDVSKIKAKMNEYFSKIFVDQINFELNAVDAIPPNKNGKTPIFIKNF